MLTQYKNLNQILNSSAAISGDRFTLTDHNLFDNVAALTPVYDIVRSSIEMHIYSNQTWLSGNHGVDATENQSQVTIPNQNNPYQGGYTPINIDVYKEFSNLNISVGNFRVVFNFFNNLIGSYLNQFLFIDEISPDRTELKIRISDATNPLHRYQITNFITRTHQNAVVTNNPTYISHQVTDSDHRTYILNFSRNKILKFVNSVVIDGEFLFVKLQDPAPDFVDLKLKCWIAEELKYPYIDHVSISDIIQDITYNQLSNANWDAYQSYNISSETGIKNWNDLLGSSVQTSQQIVDSYFSGSLSGIKLNIDYTDFNNFIFYSSAEERLHNFKYKLELLEYYTDQINTLNSISGSTATTNIADYTSNKTKLIGGFDTFENYLYYQSSSVLHTYVLPHESPNVTALTGSYVTPLPKSNSTYPYTIYPISSSQFTTWYTNLATSASLYDSLNLNKLANTLPQSLIINEDNLDLVSFVNMLGHHYDILYTYINHMTTINKREENPKLGMPNELLYSVAKQFGWSLQDGSQHHDLWRYALGTDSTGTPLTGSLSVGEPSTPGRELTHTIWRRIVNNLPLLLKSKGTKRSVQALLSCYGIPESMISINEYGGPSSDDNIPIYETLNFNYALDLINNATGTVNINYTTPVNSFELRFRTDDVLLYPTLPSNMNLITIVGSQLNVTLNYTRGTLGTITIHDHNLNTATSGEIELFDGNWLSMLVQTNGTNLDLYVKKAKYGKIVAAVSASMTGSIPSPGVVELGGIDTGISRLRGQLQELRLWSSSLNLNSFDTHVKAPGAYVGNVDAYDELTFRLPLITSINHTLTSSMSGVQPAISTISASFASWSSALPYDSIEETYYYDAISAGFNSYNDNKVRIESSNLIGTLDIKTKAESSDYDNAPLDSNRVGVYFSPETMIDEDIMAQMGYLSLDDYIGDPGDGSAKSYPNLINLSNQYWRKYKIKNDINAYIKMFTMFDMSFFDQLDQLLPARADNLTGLVIQPTLLERNKDRILPVVSYENDTYESLIDAVVINADSTYMTYDSSIFANNISLQDSSLSDAWEVTISLLADQYGTSNENAASEEEGSINITGSTRHEGAETYTLTPGSGGGFGRIYSVSDIDPTRPRGTWNHTYGGSQMSSPGFNLPSPYTINGEPVVQINEANPTRIIYRGGITNDGAFVVGKSRWNIGATLPTRNQVQPTNNSIGRNITE